MKSLRWESILSFMRTAIQNTKDFFRGSKSTTSKETPSIWNRLSIKGKKLTITVDEIFRKEALLLGSIGNEIIYTSNFFGKVVPNDGYIVDYKKGLVRHIIFNPKSGHASISLMMTVKDLEKFVKKVKKREAMFKRWSKKNPKLGTSFFAHLNPELSFFFKEPKKK